jgi:transcriptional regulator with XRE-family HTH domain
MKAIVPTVEEVARDLRSFRRQSGVSYERLAGEAGVSRQSISAYLNGRTRPQPETVNALYEAMERLSPPTAAV